ncbi:MAG: response regulator [Candidatus Aenigmatarchaeota archaeon]
MLMTMAKKIMVVDDDEIMINLVKDVLEQGGFEVIDVNNGQACLEKLKTVKPDLILMDMMMPRMSGRDTVDKIRKNPHTMDLKIAFLTVVRFTDLGKDTLKDLNISDYITKPFNNNDLIARVKKIVGQ